MASTPLPGPSHSLHNVPDVLYHIFAYLDPIHQLEWDKAYESRQSLAIAARTCRGFRGPALDILWRRLPDDQPLADLLCEVGIGTREGDAKELELLAENKPRRDGLPNQGGARVGLRRPGDAAEYERRWRLSRGYDIRYVSAVPSSFMLAPSTETSLSAFTGQRRPS